ncbi:GNAT family N-acetyltransferase [Sphingomonas sp. BIUV-7]|uniref:GNAT family N-acetyltransferase n=1 Tax=Sphingomonas natans TaxID=3063330 RepID=A0ABT8YE37_9SPHN|nr:GNAT family N-acetyltransferase [Sphingomonas sp. BIUV-7]MDO6416612.1 GNAT family N-acetyltransferase [Sphingomonas sp. BIUV-7]
MTETMRRATADDAARLSLLGGATFLTSFAFDHPGDAIVEHVQRTHSPEWYAATIADPDCAIWIVETELGAPVGYAVMTPPDVNHPTRPGDLELKRIYVLHGWQQGGWGVKLLRAVEAEAAARGADRLLLCVYTVNHRAQRFYAREGFADTGSRQAFLVGDVPFDDAIWEKALPRTI